MVSIILLLGALGCGEGSDAGEEAFTAKVGDFPGAEYAGKSDVFGRALVGPAAPYPADEGLNNREDQLRSHMGSEEL